MRYTVTMQLDKFVYDLLRTRYGKRVTVKASTLVEMAVAEVARDQAKAYAKTHGYAPIDDDDEAQP